MEPRPDGPTPPAQSRQRLPLLSLPRPALAYVLAVEALAVALVISAPARADLAQVGLAALLVAACILQHEAALSAERGYRRATIKRESTTETGHLVTNSVYTVVAALLFSPILIAATAAAIYGYRILRIDRPRIPRERGPVYRTIFTASTVVVAGTAAHYLAAALGLDLAAGATTLVPIASTVLALLVYTSVQAGLVAGIVLLAAGRLAARDMVTDLRQHGFELASSASGRWWHSCSPRPLRGRSCSWSRPSGCSRAASWSPPSERPTTTTDCSAPEPGTGRRPRSCSERASAAPPSACLLSTSTASAASTNPGVCVLGTTCSTRSRASYSPWSGAATSWGGCTARNS